MFTSQAVADLALMLSGVTTVDVADRAIKQALRTTGLLSAPTVDQDDIARLLVALAAQGGPIEEMAVEMAIHGIGGTGPAAGGRAS
ncbi:MAG: hypothetical protein WC273_00300 [Dehalococcoidia bacterium]